MWLAVVIRVFAHGAKTRGKPCVCQCQTGKVPSTHRLGGHMRSGNPVLKSDTFDMAPVGARMTLGGTVNKTPCRLALLLIPAGATGGRFYDNAGNPAAIMPLVWGGCIGGL